MSKARINKMIVDKGFMYFLKDILEQIKKEIKTKTQLKFAILDHVVRIPIVRKIIKILRQIIFVLICSKKPKFVISDFQKVVRDFAFILDEKYKSSEIVAIVKKVDQNLIKSIKIFDVYQGENIELGKKSIALSVTLEPKDKTLDEKDIEIVSNKIISIVKETTNATLRS